MDAPQVSRLRAALADRYTLERELGRGGMATVWLARDLKHDRAVAVKVLRPELAQALGPERFLREIQLTARLDHPHILPLLDSGQADGFLYYVMPRVEGESLRDRLQREKQLPLDEALQITREVADALSYAHRHDVVHRDVKPENILLAAGHARVADFGIARAITAAGGEKLTETGIAVGTPAYMSPEQTGGGHEIDGRSDVYSLATVLYELLAGAPPFTGATPQAVLARKSADPVPRLRTVRDVVPEALERVIGRALAPVPADRYATAQEFAAALAVDVEAYRRRDRILARLRHGVLGLAAALALAAAVFGWTRFRTANAWKEQPVSRGTVAVVPFRATATDPTLTNLGEMVMDLLFAVLTGDVGPRAVETGSLLRKWNDMTARGQTAAPDAPLRLAAHFGAGLLLEGVVVQTGRRLTVNAWLRAVPDGEEVARATVTGSVDSLGALPHSLFVALLGNQLGQDAERVASLANQDQQAVTAYLAGVQAHRAGAYRRAADHFSAAVKRDSTFALAALGLMRTLVADVRNHSAAYRAAQGHRDRLTPRDQATLDALSENVNDLRAAVGAVEHWVAMSPDDPVAFQELGFILHVAGVPLRIPDWRARAGRAWDVAWALDSVTPASVARMSRATWHMGDLARLRRVGPRYLAISDTNTDWWVAHRWAIAIAQGDSATVQALRARAAAGDPRVGSMRVAWTATVLSTAAGIPLDDAELFTSNASALTTGDDTMRMIAATAVAALASGRMKDMLAMVYPSSCSNPFPWCPGPAGWAGRLDLWLEYPGLSGEAAAAADSLSAWSASGRGFSPESGLTRADGLCYPLIYRAARGDTVGLRRAITGIRTALRDEHPPAVCPLLVDALIESYDTTRATTPALDTLESVLRWRITVLPHLPLVARLRRERGQPERALAAARARFLGWGGDFLAFTPYLREEGHAAAALGDTAAAIRAYTHYLTLKSAPDPGHAAEERNQVRAALARLTRAPRQ